MRCVGGPFDGEDIDTTASLVTVEGHPGMAYVRTRPTDTDWRSHIDPNWFIRGLPEPVPPTHVLEWHEDGWLSPEVRAIRSALEPRS